MGESMDSLFLRGGISARAVDRNKPKILRQTRVNRPNEEPFHGKQGLGDQGGADWTKPLDGGDKSVAGTGHIDTKQKKGGPGYKAPTGPGKRSSKPPQKFLRGTKDDGGNAGAEKQPIHRAQIDDAGTQKPDFPKGGMGVGPRAAKGGGATDTYVKTKTKRIAVWKDNPPNSGMRKV